MKVNQSLKGLASISVVLLVFGLIFLLIGMGLGIGEATSYGTNSTAEGFSVLFMQIGGAMAGLGIFGAFLRLTAAAIIEGLGGSIAVSQAQVSLAEAKSQSLISNLATSSNSSARTATLESNPRPTNTSDSWQQLNGKEYKAWLEAGQPDLESWDSLGRPDFITWLKDNA